MSKEKQFKFGTELIAAIVESFEKAYVLHQRGESQAALLITYDIYVAANDFVPAIVNAHRSAIKSAVEAVDQGMPLHFARWMLVRKLETKMAEVLEDET